MYNFTNTRTTNWLENALDFNVYLISELPGVRAITNQLFIDIYPKITPIRSKNRYTDALQSVLLNLYVGWRSGIPVRYSRNKNNYGHHKRYGLLYFKYKRLKSIIDCLEELGIVEQAIGRFYQDRDFGRQTRMWATQELIEIFELHQFNNKRKLIQRAQPEEIIQLRNKDKILIGYSNRLYIRDMRNKLYDYNAFMYEQHVTVEIPEDVAINKHYLNSIQSHTYTNTIEINQVIPLISTNNTTEHNNNGSSTILYTNNNRNNSINIYTTYTMTKAISELYNNINMIDCNHYTNIPNWYRAENRYNLLIDSGHSHNYYNIDYSKLHYKLNGLDKIDNKIKIPVSDYGIEHIDYTINYKYSHRVFNNCSFDLGGRFYGSYHLELPSEVRKHIKINGHSTVEMDYEALHVRMLYHLKNKDYSNDPYNALNASKEERKACKTAILVAINAKNEHKAIWATKNEFINNDIKYSRKFKAIRNLIYRFQAVHSPIADYLFSGIGLTLQNMDSKITEAILVRLMEQNIPCLPIHDSYIVEEQYEGILIEVMMSEYEKMFGFKPVIG